MSVARFWLPLVLLLLIASPSWGSAFTLLNSIIIDGSNNDGTGVLGSIDPVFDQTGSIAATAGTVTGPLGGPQDVFYFSISLTAGSADVDFLGVTIGSPTATLGNPRGVGYLDGAGEAPTAIAADNTIDLAAEYAFGTPFLVAGETSRRLFSTHEIMVFSTTTFMFEPTGPGEIQVGQTVNFMVGTGLGFDVNGILAPEPGTAALLALGLTGLAMTVRSRRPR